jgi:hypothetical protein
VVDHLVNDRGLEFDRDAVPAPGRIVFVYRRTRDSRVGIRDSGARGTVQGTPQPARAASRNAQATLHKVAA